MNSNFFFVFFFNFCPRTDVKFHWPGEGGTGRVSDENSPSPSEPALGGGNGRLLQSSKLLLLVSPDSARLLLPSPTPDSHLGVLICCQQRNWKSKWTADGQRAFNRLARPSPWKCPSIDCSHRSLWQLQRPTHSTRWNHQLKNGIKVSGGRRRQSCSNAQLGNSTRLWLFIYFFFLVFFFVEVHRTLSPFVSLQRHTTTSSFAITDNSTCYRLTDRPGSLLFSRITTELNGPGQKTTRE